MSNPFDNVPEDLRDMFKEQCFNILCLAKRHNEIFVDFNKSGIMKTKIGFDEVNIPLNYTEKMPANLQISTQLNNSFSTDFTNEEAIFLYNAEDKEMALHVIESLRD